MSSKSKILLQPKNDASVGQIWPVTGTLCGPPSQGLGIQTMEKHRGFPVAMRGKGVIESSF